MRAPDTAVLDRIIPGADFIIAADTDGDFAITPVPAELAPVAAGLIRYETQFRCMDVVKQLGDPSQPTRRLERLEHIKDLDVLLRWGVGDPVVTVTVDRQRRVYLSRKHSADLRAAREALNGKHGHWLLARFDGGRWLPSPEQTDPFSTAVPIPGSLVVAESQRVTGLFSNPGKVLPDWVSTHFPSGYYVVKVLERCAVVDHGMRSAPESHFEKNFGEIGDYHVYEKLADGATRLLLVTRDETAARQFLDERPGLLLLGRWIDIVDMH